MWLPLRSPNTWHWHDPPCSAHIRVQAGRIFLEIFLVLVRVRYRHMAITTSASHGYHIRIRDPEMVYPRITRVKVIPRLSPGYQIILKVMDNACSAYVLQCTVQSSHRAQDEALLSAAL